MKNFVYLVQGSATRIGEYLHLRERPNADAFFLTYDQEREGCIFFPDSTFMQGRNRMLAEARKLGDYRYFIFMDDDVEFVRGGYDEFESSLLQLRPAVGVPVFGRTGQSVVGFGSGLGPVYLPYLDWQIAWDYDGQMNAYHRDIVLDGLAIPYWESFAHNWFIADVIPCIITRNFYPGKILQFNRIVISNKIHREYPAAKGAPSAAKQWVAGQFHLADIGPPITPDFRPIKFFRRLLLPIKSRYFKRDHPRGIIGPILHLQKILKETRAYQPCESYRADPKSVAEMLHPDSPLYRQYLRHRAPD